MTVPHPGVKARSKRKRKRKRKRKKEKRQRKRKKEKKRKRKRNRKEREREREGEGEREKKTHECTKSVMHRKKKKKKEGRAPKETIMRAPNQAREKTVKKRKNKRKKGTKSGKKKRHEIRQKTLRYETPRSFAKHGARDFSEKCRLRLIMKEQVKRIVRIPKIPWLTFEQFKDILVEYQSTLS